MSSIHTFHCPNCGGPLDFSDGDDTTIRCPFCNSSVIVPENLRKPTTSYTASSSVDPAPGYTVQHMVIDLSPDQSISPAAQAKARRWIGCVAALIVAVALFTILIPVLIALPIFSATSRVITVSISQTQAPTTTILLTSPTPSFAQLIFSFGSSGIGPGQFEDARSITVDGEGFIYVGEYNNGRIQRFNRAGEYQSEWRVEEQGNLYNISAAQDGSIYAAFHGEILRFDGKSGQHLGKLEYKPDHFFEDVLVAPDGDLLAISDGEDILRFSSSGDVELSVPAAISTQTGRAELKSSLAVDGLGNIYVLAHFNEGIFKFGPDGRFIDRFGKGGDELGQLSAPYGITVDGQTRIYISDGTYVQVFSGDDGQYIDRIEVKASTYRLTVDSQQALYVVTIKPSVAKYKLPPP